MTWLANERQLAPPPHKQALSALLFLYSKVLGIHLPRMQEIGRPRVKKRLPVGAQSRRGSAALRHLDGVHRLFAQLRYGTGLRLTEGLQLRVKDVDFAHSAIVVREGKGGKDRIVMLPQALVAGLREQLAYSHNLWLADQAEGRGGVEMPHALDRKYPRAGASCPWFWVFPQDHHATDAAQRRGGAPPPVRPDVSARVQTGRAGLRHRQASHPSQAPTLLRDAFAAVRCSTIRTVQDLLGHADVATTMIHTHVLKLGGGTVRSPLDAL